MENLTKLPELLLFHDPCLYVQGAICNCTGEFFVNTIFLLRMCGNGKPLSIIAHFIIFFIYWLDIGFMSVGKIIRKKSNFIQIGCFILVIIFLGLMKTGYVKSGKVFYT